MDVFRNIASSLNKRFQMTIWTIKFAFLSIGFGCTIFWTFKCGIPYCFSLLLTSVPRIWMSFRSWLVPPYLYILVNIIIIGIAASSSYQQRLHKEEDDDEKHKKKERQNEHQQQVNESNLSSSDKKACPAVNWLEKDDILPNSGDMSSDDKKTSLSVSWLEKNNMVSSFSDKDHVLDAGGGNTEFENKPMVSSHLGTKKLTKAYRRTVSVKVPSPSHSLLGSNNVKKKQEETNVESNDNTLDSMWKAITEGKGEPLTRQLKKSDTWDVTPNVIDESGSTRPELRKSETFNDAAAPASSTKTSCGSSTGRASVLRRAAEKSLGVDELNWRVEAFINKFKNDIRLQREESDVRYMEMVNRSVY